MSPFPLRTDTRSARLSRLWVALLVVSSGCGTEDSKPATPDTAGGLDAFIFTPQDTSGGGATDTLAGTAAAGHDAAGAADTTTDGGAADSLGQTGQLVGVEVAVGKTDLLLAERTTLVVTAVRSNGSKGPPTKDEAVSVQVDGLTQAGAGVAAGGVAQPAVAAWSFGGKLQLVGVRPGSAKVIVTIGGQSAAAVTLNVAWPTTPGVWAAVADASGTTMAERQADLPDTVQLQGKTAGADGLTATIRFPLSAKAGDRLDLTKPPAKGSLSLTLAFADLGGASAKPAEGALWIDQTDKGLFRGTFLGRTTQLKPAVGVFIVERQGMFGIDLLDEPTELVTSDNLLPTTGEHYSRVSLAAVGDGNAVLYARRITDGLKANLERWQISGKTGKITALPPLVANANAYVDTPATKAPAFGHVVRASHPTVTAELWEGRDGKGATKPHRLYVHLLDAKGVEIAKPVMVSDDVCDGACRPVVAVLPSTRFIVMWSAPGGGVKVRRIKGQPAAGEVDFAAAQPLVLAPQGTGGTLAVHESNVLTGWFDPDQGHVWRQYTDKSTGNLSALAPAQAVGVASTKAPPQSLLAVQTPAGAPNLLFVSAWVDYAPTGKLAMRRIGLDGTAFGLPSPIADVDADALWGRVGKAGQIALLHRSSNGALVLRKRLFGSFKDTGAPLGDAVTMLANATYPVAPALVYLADADVWILAWSGDETSPGVYVRRFR